MKFIKVNRTTGTSKKVTKEVLLPLASIQYLDGKGSKTVIHFNNKLETFEIDHPIPDVERMIKAASSAIPEELKPVFDSLVEQLGNLGNPFVKEPFEGYPNEEFVTNDPPIRVVSNKVFGIEKVKFLQKLLIDSMTSNNSEDLVNAVQHTINIFTNEISKHERYH